MPTYEYRRPDGTTFEVQQSFSDEPLTVDPETGVPVERVLHPPAVHFKGKGFYNTDYGTRRRQRETAAAAEGGSSEGGSEGDAGKKASSREQSSGASGGKAGGDKPGGDKPGGDSGGDKRSKPAPANG